MTLQFFYAPRTRAFTTLWLLEELGVEYALESFDINSGRHKQADFLALNPMGKIPVVVHDGTSVAETGAIAIYLSDLFKTNALSPSPSDPKRADYLRWLFFASGVLEPAYGEKFFKWENIPSSSVAWGSFDQMLDTLTEGIGDGPWLLGDTFSAADVVVGNGMRFGQMFGVMPKEGPLGAYAERLTSRDGFKRAQAIEDRESERFPRE